MFVHMCKKIAALVLLFALILPVYAEDGGDALVKRGDVIVALYEREGSPVVVQSVAFPDAAGTEYANAAVWAKGAGIVNGDGDGLFHGDRAVTRAELAAMFFRFAGYKGADVSIGSDRFDSPSRSDIPGWAVSELEWAFMGGILHETEGGEAGAWGSVTAAELTGALKKWTGSIRGGSSSATSGLTSMFPCFWESASPCFPTIRESSET